MSVDYTDEMNELDRIKVRIKRVHVDAFLKLETLSDLHDAVFLLLNGYQIAIEPVPGLLAGMAHPTKSKFHYSNPKYRVHTLRIGDSPYSLAAAVVELLRQEYRDQIEIDLSGVRPARANLVEVALGGVIGLLNRRAGRLLTPCDIADLLEWVLLLAPGDARLDCSTPYGAPGWGWFVRRQTDTPELEGWRPEPSQRMSRTVACYVKPDRDELNGILEYTATCGHAVGITNAQRLRELLPYGRALTCDKAFPLSSYCSAERIDLNLSWYGDDEQQWRAIRLAARHLIRQRPAPASLLQDCWSEADSYRQLVQVQVSGTPMTDDLARHALHGAAKQCDEDRVPRPAIVTCDPQPVVRVDPDSLPTDTILDGWDRFLGGVYVAKSV